jgi:hypothetical protein
VLLVTYSTAVVAVIVIVVVVVIIIIIIIIIIKMYVTKDQSVLKPPGMKVIIKFV